MIIVDLNGNAVGFEGIEGAIDLIDELIAKNYNLNIDTDIAILLIWKALAGVEDSKENVIQVVKETVPNTDIVRLHIMTENEIKRKLLGENCSLFSIMESKLKLLGYKSVYIIGAEDYVFI